MMPLNDSSSSSGPTGTTSSNAPRSFCCPLTMDVMIDPVIDAEGNTFERQALMHWLSLYGVSPVSRQPLNASLVVTNFALRDTIHEMMGASWVAQRTEELGQQYPLPEEEETMSSSQSDSMDCSSSSHYSRSSSKNKYRGKMQCYLQKLSQDVGGGMKLELNENGICMFNCQNLTIVVEVPEDLGFFFLYTVVTVSSLSEESKDMMLELNRLQSETRGGTLSTKKHESGHYDIFFSYSDRINEISAADFCNIVPNFIETGARMKARFLGVDHRHNMLTPPSMSPSQEGTCVGRSLHQKYL